MSQIDEGEGVVQALRMFAEDSDEYPGTGITLDIDEVTDLLAYVESLERQINAHPPAETDPDA